MAGTLGLDRVRAAPQPDLSGPRAAAWALWGATVAFLLAGLVLTLVTLDEPAPADFGFRGFQLLIAVPLSTVALVLTHRRPGNPIGWLLGSSAAVGALQFGVEGYAVFALLERDRLAGGAAAAWLQNWLWVPLIALIAVFVVLLFPDGRLPSRRWRWALAFGVVATAVGSAAQALKPGPLENFSLIDNPLAIEGWNPDSADSLLGLFMLAILAAAASLVVRFRRSSGIERQQLKVMVFAASGMAVAVSLNALVEGIVGGGTTGAANKAAQIGTILGMVGLPVAAGIAVLRYGLYEIDVVINKTLVYGALAAFVTAVYVGLVAGLGTLIGDRSNLAVSMLAATVIAVGFQPVRERVQRFANRLVYGERASPYEVLSSFSSQLDEVVAGDELLVRMARLLGEGTGAARTEVQVRVGNTMQSAATWGHAGGPPDLEVPVDHQGEQLGALLVTKPRDEALTPADEKLVRDLAAQAGLVLRNVALIADLRASRQRLVVAQDEERRRLERNLHDGAQQQLVALKVQLGLARTVAEREGATQAAGLLEQVVVEADDALNNLRDLARGIYPPLLAAEGLPRALRGQAEKASVPTDVVTDDIGRYGQEVEATVYFCCLEAMQNVAKYALADSCQIKLWQDDRTLWFRIADDGAGFDPAVSAKGAGLQNMADRLDAVDGSITVESQPGEGTTVTGSIPVG